MEPALKTKRSLTLRDRIFLATVAMVCAAGIVASIVFGLPASEPVITSCDEFETWQEAKEYWDANIDDARVLNYLDSNGNGIPCEQIVDYPGVDRKPIVMDYVCDDFDYWEQAQEWYDTWVDTYPELLRLDGDRNGIACQNIPEYNDVVAVVERLNRLQREGLR